MFLTELNKYRLQLRELIDPQDEVSSQPVMNILLKIQLLLYQNKDDIELAHYLDVNTTNLLKLINWEHQIGYNSNQGN